MIPKTLPRDPEAPQRTRHFIDVVGNMLNSMILSGELVQDGADSWTFLATEQSILVQQIFGK